MFQTPELDLSVEVADLLHTDKDCSPIKAPMIWVRFRRDSNSNKIRCNGCNGESSVYKEGQKSCPYCSGYGYLFDEQIIDGYLYKYNEMRSRFNMIYPSEAGRLNSTDFQLITDKTILIEEEDKIKVPKLNTNGMIKVPLVFEDIFMCLYSRTYRASYNKAEFNLAVLGG